MSSHLTRKGFGFKTVSLVQAVVFILSSLALPLNTYAQGVLDLPAPGVMVNLSEAHVPVMLRAVKIHPDQPLVFDFIVDSGNTHGDQAFIKAETQKLVKYFLASLTIPEKDLWVNLSPYEHERVVPEAFGQTEMGRDLLAQDYILKQLTATIIDPEKDLGRRFWDRIYAQTREQLGTSDIPTDTFSKVWIMADSAQVYEMNNAAVLGKSRLKVMTEEDYLAASKGADVTANSVVQNAASAISSRVMRDIIIPAIENEVNTGKNFAPLRQMYQSLVLSIWYKNAFKEGFLAQVYADKNKIVGIDLVDMDENERIYQRYIAAYKQGVFNYIREETDPVTHESFPRKYFSGGNDLSETQRGMTVIKVKGNNLPADIEPKGQIFRVTSKVAPVGDGGIISGTDINLFTRLKPDARPYPVFDFNYLKALFFKYLFALANPGKEKRMILDKSAFGVARLTQSDRKKYTGEKNYGDSRTLEHLLAAKGATLRYIQMNGGAGSAMLLHKYLQTFGREKTGAKGTDIYFPLDKIGFNKAGEEVLFHFDVSVTELTYLQAIAEAKNYGLTQIQQLANTESNLPIEEMLDTVYLPDRTDQRPGSLKRTYRQILMETDRKVALLPRLEGSFFPVIDVKTGELTNEFPVGGGHGRIACQVLHETMTTPEGRPVITVIRNGDNPNSAVDGYIVGMMIKERIPIAMFFATRTPLDVKGGIEVVDDVNGRAELKEGVVVVKDGAILVPDILELAQAKDNDKWLTGKGMTSDQLVSFLKVGVKMGYGEIGGQRFNTNMAAIQENIVGPFLKKLEKIIGPDKFSEITTPDLILNEKVKGKGENERKIIQLEGAMASVLFNLNRFVLTTDDVNVMALKKEFGLDRLVHVINFDEEWRDSFFAPIKKCTDVQNYISNFYVNPDTYKLVNKFPGHLFEFGEMSGYYDDMQNVRNAFGDANLGALEQMSVKTFVTPRQFEAVGLDFNRIFPILVQEKNVSLEGSVIRDTAKLDEGFRKFLLEGDKDQFDKIQAILNNAVSVGVQFKDAIFRGSVQIENRSGRDINLNVVSVKNRTQKGRYLQLDGKLLLENVRVVVDELGVVVVYDNAGLVDENLNIDQSLEGLGEEGMQPFLQRDGGINLNNAEQNIKIERFGRGVQFTIDPSEIARIKAQGGAGFTSIILNIVPLKGLAQGLGS